MPIKSPFPGMDPYLEAHWRDIHSRLVIYACDAMQVYLPRGLIARVEERVVVDAAPEPQRSVYPDVRVIEHGGRAGGGVAVAEPEVATIATAEPLLVHLATDPVSETFIQILDVGSGGRVVTIIEFLGLTNKAPGDGRRLYRRKQREALSGGANLVEIDLLRSGRWTMSAPRGMLPPAYRADGRVCVRRAARPDVAEMYLAPLRERLPGIRVPLRPTDPDAPLDLQALLDQAYRNGRYDTLDYKAEPDPPLTGEDAAWANEVLKAGGLR